jgi:HYR domain/Secretion system C-terminal sorting domain
VTLKDVTPPSITCPANTTVAADGTCSGLVGAYAAVAVGDNCSANPTVTQSPASTTLLTGHNDVETVTLTANDGNGNNAACTFTVTLKDVTPPSITCPANTTVAADGTCSGLVGAYAAVAVGDNCSANPTVTQSPASTTVLTGHNDVETVTLTANDGNGNIAACTFTVTLKDVTPPSVVCAPFTAALNTVGTTAITTSNVYGSGSDNCGTVNQVSVTPNTFTCANLGSNTVTLTVNDGNGNSSTCSAVVTVVDQIPPIMLCKNATVFLNSLGQTSITALEVNNGSSDNCTLTTLSVAPNSFTCANLGTNTITLTGTDQSGNTNTCQSIVTVFDTIKPVMLCRNATLNLNNSGQATLTFADVNNGSSDNCGIVQFSLSQTEFTCANLGANPVTLTGTDQSGNVGRCSSTVTIRDLIAPQAKCKNITVNLGTNGSVIVPPLDVNNGTTDNCTFSLSVAPTSFSCANIGIQTVTLTATDGSGNTGTCTAKVTVRDITPPTALCKNLTVFLNDVGKATISAVQIDNGSFDNCSITTRSLSRTQFNCSDIGSPFNEFLTATDGSGNSSTCATIITVKDNLAPTPVCRNVTVTLGSNGSVTVYPAMLADSSFDNCSIWTFAPVARTYTSANIGANNLLITVKDWSNNASTCTSVVTVVSNGPSERPQDASVDTLYSTDRSGLKMALYPNPTAGDALIHFELETEQVFVLRVYDQSGSLVFSQKEMGTKGDNNILLPSTSFVPGLYFIHLQTNGKSAKTQLIFQG